MNFFKKLGLKVTQQCLKKSSQGFFNEDGAFAAPVACHSLIQAVPMARALPLVIMN